MEQTQKYKPVVLIILDGWGVSLSPSGNAIMTAKTPNMDALERNYPFMTLQASGIAVGLPWGEVGNSEVGHLNLGAGFVRYQDLPRITMEIQNGSFFENKVLVKAIEKAKEKNTSLHLMGLLGNGNVHSSMEHLEALIELCRKQKMKNVFLHLFTDGRDTAPQSSLIFLKELNKTIKKFRTSKIASICGRYYAMDRNENWDRTQKAYDALLGNCKNQFKKPELAIKSGYDEGKTDEYMPPAVITEKGNPMGPIKDGDSVIFFNYRPDRARQITKAFVLPSFNKFPITEMKDLHFATMTKYDDSLPVEIAYEEVRIVNPLAKVISDKGKRQLHIAETEKYAHVTYFFNGGKEETYPGEKHVLIPSPAVSDYATRPDMSARLIGDRVVKEIAKGQYDFVLINIANPDMIGHTGNMKQAITAIEATDQVLGQIVNAVQEIGGTVVITADHGNAENMMNLQTKENDTEHSTSNVPLCIVDNRFKKRNSEKEIVTAKANSVGILADVAPTVLGLMNIEKPKEMTGTDLVKSLGIV